MLIFHAYAGHQDIQTHCMLMRHSKNNLGTYIYRPHYIVSKYKIWPGAKVSSKAIDPPLKWLV